MSHARARNLPAAFLGSFLGGAFFARVPFVTLVWVGTLVTFFFACSIARSGIRPGVDVGGSSSSWLEAKGADLKNCSGPGKSSSIMLRKGEVCVNCAGSGSMSRSSIFESIVAFVLTLSLTERRALNIDNSSGSNCFFFSAGSASLTTNWNSSTCAKTLLFSSKNLLSPWFCHEVL